MWSAFRIWAKKTLTVAVLASAGKPEQPDNRANTLYDQLQQNPIGAPGRQCD